MKKELMFFFMANLVRADTGLPINIWVSPRLDKYKPRIYVQKDYKKELSTNIFSISISDNPKVHGNPGSIKDSDIEKVKEFVRINKQLLLDHWNGVEEDIVKVILSFKKV